MIVDLKEFAAKADKSKESNSHLLMIRQANLLSGLTNAALLRTNYGQGEGAIIEKYYNGVKTEWPLSLDYTNPGELILFDQLLIPKIRRLFVLAELEDLTSTIEPIFSPQARYALRIGSVQEFSFEEITDILASRDADLSSTRGLPMVVIPYRDFRYA